MGCAQRFPKAGVSPGEAFRLPPKLPDLQEILNPSVNIECRDLNLFCQYLHSSFSMTLPRTFTTLPPADTSCSPGPIYNLPEAQNCRGGLG